MLYPIYSNNETLCIKSILKKYVHLDHITGLPSYDVDFGKLAADGIHVKI